MDSGREQHPHAPAARCIPRHGEKGLLKTTTAASRWKVLCATDRFLRRDWDFAAGIQANGQLSGFGMMDEVPTLIPGGVCAPEHPWIDAGYVQSRPVCSQCRTPGDLICGSRHALTVDRERYHNCYE